MNGSPGWLAWVGSASARRTAATLALGAGAMALPAEADTFNQASAANLVTVCRDALLIHTGITLGSNLTNVCRVINDNEGGSIFSAVPSSGSSQGGGALTIEQRLQSVREAEEEKPTGGGDARTFALNATGRSDVAQLQVPPPGGSAPELAIDLGQGIGVFATVGATALNHHNNRYEDGWESQLPAITAGADYRVADWMLAGLAFNYTNFDGTYDDGGGFDKHIFGPLLYATFLPFERTFVDVVLSYARSEASNNRLATAFNGGGRLAARGHTDSDYSENQYSANALAGYDYPIGAYTIGPRFGVAVSHTQVGSFEEDGDTGLELRYSSLSQTSVQTSLGVQGTAAWPLSWGVVMPQASAAWVHEYANDARNIQARLVEASPAPQFTFKREPPARDWAVIGLGASALLPNGLQPFVQFATMQGNENFVSYGGSVGIRVGL